MINCEKAEALFSLYMDNELNETDKNELEKHLEICDCCKNALQELQQIISLIADIGDEDLPQGFGESLHNKLLQAEEDTRKKAKVVALRNRYIKVISTIAACLLVVVLLKDYYTGGLLDLGSLKKAGNSVSSPQISRQDAEKSTASAASGFSAMDQYGNATNGGKENKAKGTDLEKSETTTKDNASIAVTTGPASEEPVRSADSAKNFGSQVIESTQEEDSKTVADGSSSAETPKATPEIEISAMIVADRVQPDAALRSELQDTKNQQVIKNSSILLAVEKPNEALNQIKVASVFYGARDEGGISLSAKAALAPQETGQTVLNVKVPEDKYEAFANYLKSTYGVSNISFSTVKASDTTEQMLSLNKRLDELNASVEALQKQDGFSQLRMDELKREKENLQNQINSIKEDIGSVRITITFMKK